MSSDNWIEGKKIIIDYLGASWNTCKKRLRCIQDVTIFYYTIARRPKLNTTEYEKKYGSPKRLV